MSASKAFLDTLPYIEIEKPGRIYLERDVTAYDENGKPCVSHAAPCDHDWRTSLDTQPYIDHDWRTFHGIAGDHIKCTRCGALGEVTITERTER